VPRLRTLFLGGVLGGVLSMVLAPRIRGARRGPLARLKPFAAFDRRTAARFSGTPCSREGVDDGPPGK